MPKYVIENGMRIEVPTDDDLTLADLRRMAPESQRDDMVCIEGNDGTLHQLQEGDPVPDNVRIVRVPEIVKGSLPRRVAEEVQILQRHIRHRSVESGVKTIDDKRYAAVIVHNFPLDLRKYKHNKTDVLFMLPPDYPRLPALGCYMQFPPDAIEEDHHATLRAHYGAPELQEQGWYWYCVGLGANFARQGYADEKEITRVWRPAGRPEDGHNLVTLYGMADRGLNTP